MEPWFVGVFVAAAGAAYFAIQAVRHRGVRGAMFGAPVARTLGELDLGRRGMISTVIRVHVLDAAGTDAPAVGLELAARSAGSFGLTPIPLTKEQPGALASMLTAAASESTRQ